MHNKLFFVNINTLYATLAQIAFNWKYETNQGHRGGNTLFSLDFILKSFI